MKQLNDEEMKYFKHLGETIHTEQQEVKENDEYVNEYEKMYKESKTQSTAYHVGYKKIAFSVWSFICAVITVFFSPSVAFWLLVLAVTMFLWGTFEKRGFAKTRQAQQRPKSG